MDLHRLAKVEVGFSNHYIVHRHDGELHFVALVEVRKVDERSVLLSYEDTFTTKLNIRLLIGLKDVIVFFTPTVASCHWRMMGHLLGQVFKVICNEFKSFPKKWIERLRGGAFANG